MQLSNDNSDDDFEDMLNQSEIFVEDHSVFLILS